MATDSNFCPPLTQIALSAIDLRLSERWFREGLGYLPAGGARLFVSSPLAARVQGVPRAASTCWWLVDQNPWFQIELFQFRRPMAKLLPSDFRPCDTGYTRMGVYVCNFDTTLENLGKLGTLPCSRPLGIAGQRRVCVRSPDGVFVEIMESDPLSRQPCPDRPCAVATRYITLSTPDLDASAAYLTAACGQPPVAIALHEDEHEALWGLAGARCKRVVFECGDVLVEVVQYIDPVGRNWPDGYRICDQGILNIAFGARGKRQHMEVYNRVSRFGAQPNCAPLHLPGAGVVYVNDALGFSVEVLWMASGKSDKEWGFEPLPREKRPAPDNESTEHTVTIAAPLERVWAVLCDQRSMGKWIGFDQVTRIMEGAAHPDGVGSERLMKGRPGTVVEQVTGIDPMRRIRYRVIKGSPFIYHNGEITVSKAGSNTEVHWRIRFRSKIPLAGPLLRFWLSRMLKRMLHNGLRPYIEDAAC